jgi:DNA-directed RNA polymerase subunit RPC12/RpoP
MKTSPPICPYCGKRLVEVLENDYSTYVFEPDSGTYKLHESKGYLEMFCPYCEAKLHDVFPDGVCNHVSKIEGNNVLV